MAVLICATFAFLLGLLALRKLRKEITEEDELSEVLPRSLDGLPLHVYNTVIQQLKQQKHELLVQSQAEQQRARTSENFSQAVLSNLSSGVLVFGANGLVKSANPAAKTILGFASTTGMSAENVFRSAVVRSTMPILALAGTDESSPEAVGLAEEVQAVLREGGKRRQVDAEYETPAHEKRFFSMTVSPVLESDGSLLGVACLINDRSELEGIRRQQELHGEISGEMALQLRTSLSTISGYAQQLARNSDPGLAEQLAKDIAQEAAQLDRTLGGFLTSERSGKPAARSAAGD
jgi:PAS domain-containing protein